MYTARPSVSIKPFFLRTLFRLTGWSYLAFVIAVVAHSAVVAALLPPLPADVLQSIPAWLRSAWGHLPVLTLERPLGVATQAVLVALVGWQLFSRAANVMARRARQARFGGPPVERLIDALRHRWYQQPVGLFAIGLAVAVAGDAASGYLGFF